MRIVLDPVKQENDELLREVFHQMVEDISNVRARNLILKHIKDYKEVGDYLNDNSLILQWRGAGKLSIERVCKFLDDFHREYKSIVSGRKADWKTRLIAIDYPFLTDKELAFVASFLQSEGRYPVLFLARCYFLRTKNRQAQVFARANGIVNGHTRFEAIAEEYGVTRERVRQLSVMSLTNAPDAGLVWDEKRWQALGFLGQPLLMEENVHWNELRQKERLGDLDFYSTLTIFRQMVPLNIVSLRVDGRRANARLSANVPWQKPGVLFGYDSRLGSFAFENALSVVGHEASLLRVMDGRISLSDLVDQHFTTRHSEEDRQVVASIVRDVLSMFDNVETEGDDIVFRANRTNYMEEIYQILQRRGQAMTIDEIHEEFRQLHPNDHHTESSFIRSYMLRDDRFEAVGSKSTYQLREWERFAGTLSDLAVHLLESCDEPVKTETLCRQMMEVRPTTTLKSCNTSIHIAVNACRLLFYNDVASADGEAAHQDDAEAGRHCVGLFDRQYPERFWPSPMTIEGIIRSMRRFLEEYDRWPFSSGKKGMEPMLYYVLRKFGNRRRVTDEELMHYQQCMADIDPNEYPSNERDLLFRDRCRELAAYCEQHHRLPTGGKLLAWYRSLRSQVGQFSSFRKHHYDRLQSAISASCMDAPAKDFR